MVSGINMDVELAPLRPLADFLLEGARFQLPPGGDPDRWANRVLNNLLYYQSNYFLLAIVTFLLVGFMSPLLMMTGCVTMGLVFYAFVVITDNKIELKRFKQRHPALCVLAMSTCLYLIGQMINGLLVFTFGLLMPVLLTFLHASLRMRNMNNKLSRFKEYVGLKRTPMGYFLEGLGQEQEAGS